MAFPIVLEKMQHCVTMSANFSILELMKGIWYQSVFTVHHTVLDLFPVLSYHEIHFTCVNLFSVDLQLDTEVVSTALHDLLTHQVLNYCNLWCKFFLFDWSKNVLHNHITGSYMFTQRPKGKWMTMSHLMLDVCFWWLHFVYCMQLSFTRKFILHWPAKLKITIHHSLWASCQLVTGWKVLVACWTILVTLVAVFGCHFMAVARNLCVGRH